MILRMKSTTRSTRMKTRVTTLVALSIQRCPLNLKKLTRPPVRTSLRQRNNELLWRKQEVSFGKESLHKTEARPLKNKRRSYLVQSVDSLVIGTKTPSARSGMNRFKRRKVESTNAERRSLKVVQRETALVAANRQSEISSQLAQVILLTVRRTLWNVASA